MIDMAADQEILAALMEEVTMMTIMIVTMMTTTIAKTVFVESKVTMITLIILVIALTSHLKKEKNQIEMTTTK